MPRKGTHGGLMERSFSWYLLKWSVFSSRTSSIAFFKFVGIAWNHPILASGHTYICSSSHLVSQLEAKDGGRAHSGHNGEHAIEVIQLLHHHHDFDDPRHDRYALLNILSLDYGLFQPEGEIGRVTHHFQQIRRRYLLVSFGPDGTDQLGWFHCTIQLEMQKSQLSCNFYRVELGRKFRKKLMNKKFTNYKYSLLKLSNLAHCTECESR